MALNQPPAYTTEGRLSSQRFTVQAAASINGDPHDTFLMWTNVGTCATHLTANELLKAAKEDDGGKGNYVYRILLEITTKTTTVLP